MKKAIVLTFALALCMGTAQAANICAGWGACDTVTLEWFSSYGTVSTDTSSFQDDSGYTDSTSMHLGDGGYLMWGSPSTSGMITTGSVSVAYDFWCWENAGSYHDIRWDLAGGGKLIDVSPHAPSDPAWYHWQGSGVVADTGGELNLGGRLITGAGYCLLDSVWAEPTVPVEDWYMY